MTDRSTRVSQLYLISRCITIVSSCFMDGKGLFVCIGGSLDQCCASSCRLMQIGLQPSAHNSLCSLSTAVLYFSVSRLDSTNYVMSTRPTFVRYTGRFYRAIGVFFSFFSSSFASLVTLRSMIHCRRCESAFACTCRLPNDVYAHTTALLRS